MERAGVSVCGTPRATERRRASAEQKGPSQLPWDRRERGETKWERRVENRGCSESSHRGSTFSVKRRSGPPVRGAEQGGWQGLKRFESACVKDGRGTDQALERGPLRTKDHYPQQ